MSRDPTHDPPERRSGKWRTPSLSTWFQREAVADARVEQARDREAAALTARADHAERVVRLQWAVIVVLVGVVVALAGGDAAVAALGVEVNLGGAPDP